MKITNRKSEKVNELNKNDLFLKETFKENELTAL